MIKDFERQKDNRYSSISKGPFIVCIIDSDPENNLGNYHIVEIGIKFFDAGFKVISVKKDNIKRVSVIFDSFLDANDFVANGMSLISTQWLAYIPDDGLYNIGLVYDIPADIS